MIWYYNVAICDLFPAIIQEKLFVTEQINGTNLHKTS